MARNTLCDDVAPPSKAIDPATDICVVSQSSHSEQKPAELSTLPLLQLNHRIKRPYRKRKSNSENTNIYQISTDIKSDNLSFQITKRRKTTNANLDIQQEFQSLTNNKNKQEATNIMNSESITTSVQNSIIVASVKQSRRVASIKSNSTTGRRKVSISDVEQTSQIPIRQSTRQRKANSQSQSIDAVAMTQYHQQPIVQRKSYAERLSKHSSKGDCGSIEIHDSKSKIELKCKQLVEWLQECRSQKNGHCFVLTGAGISTSCGIADFRGPNGVWTIEKQAKEAKSSTTKTNKRKQSIASRTNKISQKSHSITNDNQSNAQFDTTHTLNLSNACQPLPERQSMRIAIQQSLESIDTKQQQSQNFTIDNHTATFDCDINSDDESDWRPANGIKKNALQSSALIAPTSIPLSNKAKLEFMTDSNNSTGCVKLEQTLCSDYDIRTSNNAASDAIISSDDAFESARPSFTHMALAALHHQGYIHHVASQNVDGLHQLSGLPRDAMSELHGNIFVERCQRCGAEYRSANDLQGMNCQFTGRKCTESNCRGLLRDTVIDWKVSFVISVVFVVFIKLHNNSALVKVVLSNNGLTRIDTI
jgi:NAD-dependent SIR2 family protein deacetylase